MMQHINKTNNAKVVRLARRHLHYDARTEFAQNLQTELQILRGRNRRPIRIEIRRPT